MNFHAVKPGSPNLVKPKAVAKAAPKAEAKEADAEEKKSSDHLTLPPKNRHHWDDSKAAWVQRVRKTVFPLMFREKVTGMENVPKDGAYIVGPTHQSMFDAVAAMKIPGKRAFGSMAAAEQFTGIVGKMMSVSSVFPVDRYKEFEGDFAHPVDHAVEILNEGKPFIFYPEGRIYEDEQVYPLKTGIGRIGMNSTAKYTLPVAKTFGKDDETHWGEWAVGLAVSAAAGSSACSSATA